MIEVRPGSFDIRHGVTIARSVRQFCVTNENTTFQVDPVSADIKCQYIKGETFMQVQD